MVRLNTMANVPGSNDVKLGNVVLPEGEYSMMIVDTQEKETKNKVGKYIETTYVITQEGPYKGIKLFGNIMHVHTNANTVEIALKKLNSIADACGLTNVEDTNSFHNIPFIGKVKTQPGEGEYQDKSVVKGFKSLQENSPLGMPASGIIVGGTGLPPKSPIFTPGSVGVRPLVPPNVAANLIQNGGIVPPPAAPVVDPIQVQPPAAPVVDPIQVQPPAAPVQPGQIVQPPAAPVQPGQIVQPPAAPVVDPIQVQLMQQGIMGQPTS